MHRAQFESVVCECDSSASVWVCTVLCGVWELGDTDSTRDCVFTFVPAC